MPKKSFLFTAEDHVYLTDLAKRLNLNQTDALRWAIRHTMEALRRGEPVYVPEPPEGPHPPTSAPSAARKRPLQLVGKAALSKKRRKAR